MRRFPILLALALAACGPKKSSKGPGEDLPVPGATPDAGVAMDPIPDKLRAEVEAAIAFVEEVATAARGATDCPGMAAAMQALADGPHAGAIQAIDSDPDFQRNAASINHTYGAQLDAMITHLDDAIATCAHDPDVEATLIQLGVLQDAPPADDLGDDQPEDE